MATATISTVEMAPSCAAQAPRLKTIIGHLSLSLLTAMVIPAVLFYTCLVTMNVWVAVVAGLAWCYGAIAWRMVTKRRASGLLALTVAIMTVRTAIALASGDTFLYFMQPIVTDILVASAFFLSLATARPVVARLAADFYPMDSEIALRPGVQRLFWRLTLLWAVVCLCRAAITLWLLDTQTLVSFVVLKSLSLFTVTTLGVTVTVFAAVAVARREGLLLPVPPKAVV